MSNLIPASELREDVRGLQHVITAYEQELAHPTHGLVGSAAEEANAQVARWLRASQSRLLKVRRQLVINTKRERLAKARHAPERRV